MKEIARIEHRYVVETERRIRYGYDSYRTEWDFSRAFKTRQVAEAYADRIAEDNEVVRIIDKGAES